MYIDIKLTFYKNHRSFGIPDYYRIAIFKAVIFSLHPSGPVREVKISVVPFTLQPSFSKTARRSIKSQNLQEIVNSLMLFSFKVVTIASTSSAHITSAKLGKHD